MFGDHGDDELFGGPGADGMEGEEDTDEHYGGRGNDFVDAAANEDPATDAPDLVDYGSGVDTALVLPNDRVRANCEEVIDASAPTVAPPSSGTTDEEQQQQGEAFLSSGGG